MSEKDINLNQELSDEVLGSVAGGMEEYPGAHTIICPFCGNGIDVAGPGNKLGDDCPFCGKNFDHLFD